MKKNPAFPIFLLLSVFLSQGLSGQTPETLRYREHPTEFKRNKRYYTLGAYIGGLNYLGDLAPRNRIGSTSMRLTGPGLGISGMYRLRRFLFLRGNFMWGRLRGDDATADKNDGDDKYRYVRNLHFRNDIKELSFELLIDFTAHHRSFVTRKSFAPFLFFGLAIFHHNPKAMVPEMDALHYKLFEAQAIQPKDPRYGGVSPGDWIPLQALGTEGQNIPGSGVKAYSQWQIALPVGLGFRYRLNRQYDLFFEVGYRHTFTDYLDDVSGHYINPEDFGEGPKANLARLMADRCKEPAQVISGKSRDLEFILQHVHQIVPHGKLPPEFGEEAYELINGYGHAGKDHIRGKIAFDAYVFSKLTIAYSFGKRIRYSKP